jgi:hypothetical protein
LVTVFGVEPGFGVVECGESTNRRAWSPYGIIASARGWLVVEIKWTTFPMARRFILCMKAFGYISKQLSSMLFLIWLFCCVNVL